MCQSCRLSARLIHQARTEYRGNRASLEVREINELESLEPFAAQWNALLPVTPGASYFHSYDWFATYWRHCGGGQRMRVLLVSDHGKLTGVVPLVAVRDHTKLGALRSLRYPLDGWGSFYGPIGRETALLLRLAIQHALATRRDWDLIDMLWVNRDGADGGATHVAFREAGLARVRASGCQARTLSSTAVGRHTGRPAKRSGGRTCGGAKSGCKRMVRSLTCDIGHRALGCNDGESRWDLYEECERIAANSWQGSSTSGTTLSHDSIRGYLRAAHEAAASFGGVDVNLLALDGRAVAFAYNYHYRGYVYGLRSGFDPNPTASGAGTVLLRMMIEDSCGRGDRVIDLGPGSPESKRHWQTRVATAWRYTHYSRRSPRAQLLRALHAVKAWL